MFKDVTRMSKPVILDPVTSPDEGATSGADALLAGEIILKAMLEGAHQAPSVFDLARGGKGPRPLAVTI